jgi:hypothetical protein
MRVLKRNIRKKILFLEEFIYFGISYDNPCSPLSFSPLPAPGSRASHIRCGE